MVWVAECNGVLTSKCVSELRMMSEFNVLWNGIFCCSQGNSSFFYVLQFTFSFGPVCLSIWLFGRAVRVKIGSLALISLMLISLACW